MLFLFILVDGLFSLKCSEVCLLENLALVRLEYRCITFHVDDSWYEYVVNPGFNEIPECSRLGFWDYINHLLQHWAVGRCPARPRTSLTDSAALTQGQLVHQFNVLPLFLGIYPFSVEIKLCRNTYLDSTSWCHIVIVFRSWSEVITACIGSDGGSVACSHYFGGFRYRSLRDALGHFGVETLESCFSHSKLQLLNVSLHPEILEVSFLSTDWKWGRISCQRTEEQAKFVTSRNSS